MTWTAALTWALIIAGCAVADLIRYSLKQGGR